MKKINTILLITAATFLAFGFAYKGNKINKKPDTVVVGLEIGNAAPELKFQDPNGKEIALSAYKGKIVLIDFWASWCGPCRMENPNVVATFNKYKDSKFKNANGFTIYSVSLDQRKEPWVAAIAKDNLAWEAHVCDFGGWGSQASRMYGVNSIPTNFLIDAKGVILAKGLRGPALEAELAKLVK